MSNLPNRVTQIVQDSGNPGDGSVAPVSVALNNIYGQKFAVGDSVHFTFMISSNIKASSDFTTELHWYSSNTTAARYVQFQIVWRAVAIGETITAPGNSGTIVSGDILLSTTANTFIETIMPVIAGTSIAVDDHLFLEISRIASVGTAPAAGDSPVLLHFEVEFMVQGLGTPIII